MKQIKYIVAIVMAMLMVSALNGQSTHKPQVTKAEYFIDTDPGIGLATALQAEDGKLGDAIEALFDKGIVVTKPGMHTFCVRVKDSLDWGPVFKTVFSVEAAVLPIQKNIAAGEYFWDKDPGEGNGKTLLAFDGNYNDALETLWNSNIAVPSKGLHSFSIRIKDVNGKWSSVFKTAISIEDHSFPRTVKVTTAELFWDKDPGTGKGTSLLAFDGNFDDAVEELFKSNVAVPSIGKHSLNIRVQAADGNWGQVFTTIVSIETHLSPRAIQVKMAELFWDKDPGTGKATPLLSFDGNFNDAIETALKSNLNTPSEPGIHSLSVRIADANGIWGTTFTTMVSIENASIPRQIGISQMELFLDNDPGEGNAIPIIAFDGNYNDAIEATILNSGSIDKKGIHTIGIRAKDKNGVWGKVFKTTISVEDKLITRKLQIVAGELFYDTDPGEGNGTPFLSLDGNYNDAIEQGKLALNSGLLNVGKHSLSVRFKGFDDVWSKAFTTVVFVDACKNSPTVTITATGSTSFCQGDSIQLKATAGMTKYNWVNGSKSLSNTEQTLYVKESGFYTAIGYDADGCPGKSVATQVKVTPLDTTLTFSRSTTLCDGEYVTASVKPGYSSYLWSNGSASTAISLNKAGNYTLSITNSGCTRVTKPFSVVVNLNPSVPVITAGGSTSFCYGDKVDLTSSTEAQYLWSNKETSQKVSITESGYYTVTVINAAGCKNTSLPFAVNVIKSIPVISAPVASMCDGDSVKLFAGAGYSKYKWSSGDTNAYAYVKKGGDYTVTVTTNTCAFQSAPYKVSLYPGVQLPIISKSDTNVFCEGGSVTLTSNSATDNYWSNGSKAASIVASNTGLYYVTVRNEYGCAKSSAPIQVTSISTTPVIAPSGTINICKGDFVELNAGGGYSTYKWTNGETTQKLKVTTAGKYAVTVTNSLCASQPVAAIPVTVNVNEAMDSAIVTHSGSFTFCTGEKLVLKSSPAYSYEWSNGSTRDSIVITQPGTYGVTVGNSFGCKNVSRKYDVNVYPQPLKASILTAGPLTFCGGDSVKLTSSVKSQINWSNGDTAQSIWVKQSGDYFVLSSSGAGCSVKSDITKITVTDVKPAIVAEGKTTFCKGDSVWLDAGKGFDSYYWSTGETKQRIKAVASNSITVKVAKNGCERLSPVVTITANDLPKSPTLTADGVVTFCKGGQVSISSTPAYKYKWSNGDTTKSIVVTATKAVYVKITDANGCSAISNDTTVTVFPVPIQPTITASDTLTFCKGDSVMLTGDYSAKYKWSNGDTTRSIMVGKSGLFNITVYNSFGCSATSQNAQVIVYDLPIPFVQSNNSKNTICTGDSIVLTTDVYKAYKWNDGSTLNKRVVKTAGLFNVRVTDNHGCTDTSNTVNIVVNTAPSPTIAATGVTEFCEGDSIILKAGVADKYEWSNGETTRSIFVKQTGVYDVKVSNNNGCSDRSTTIDVTVNTLPAKPSITRSGDSLKSTAAFAYQWKANGASIQNETSQTVKPVIQSPYLVEVSNEKGCIAISDPYIWTNIEESVVNSFTVYPNPCRVSATFSLDLKTNVDALSFRLINSLGQQVMAIDGISTTSFTIDRGSLASGVYLYKIYSKNSEIVSGKLIIE